MTLEDSAAKELKWWAIPGQFLRQELLPVLTNLRLAIALLLLIAIFSSTGTVIEQGQSPAFYQANYPEHPALFGFLTWKVIQVVGLDHVYRTWWFLSLLILFGTSLTACSFTRQLPALKAAQRWKYYEEPRQFQKLALSTELDTGSLDSLSQILQKHRYKIFQDPEKQNLLYARKGIVGRIGPIIVHIGIVAILLGGIWGAMTGFLAQEMVASGDTFQVTNIVDAGPIAAKIPKDWSVRVNRFWIDYTPSGGIDQFYSDMSVLNNQGKEIDHKKIFVNEPLRYHGITFYQTDWGIAGVRVQFNNSPVFQLPMAQLNTNGKGGRIWGTWVPTKPDLSEGVSLLAKDLQGMVLIYDATGKLVDTVRAGMYTEINGVKLKILDVIGSTGLQIKADPGIPIVYSGFGLLMLGVVMSYFSHSQIWALQKGDRLYIGGKTNRAQVAFEQEVLDILDRLSSQPKGEEKEAAIEA